MTPGRQRAQPKPDTPIESTARRIGPLGMVFPESTLPEKTENDLLRIVLQFRELKTQENTPEQPAAIVEYLCFYAEKAIKEEGINNKALPPSDLKNSGSGQRSSVGARDRVEGHKADVTNPEVNFKKQKPKRQSKGGSKEKGQGSEKEKEPKADPKKREPGSKNKAGDKERSKPRWAGSVRRLRKLKMRKEAEENAKSKPSPSSKADVGISDEAVLEIDGEVEREINGDLHQPELNGLETEELVLQKLNGALEFSNLDPITYSFSKSLTTGNIAAAREDFLAKFEHLLQARGQENVSSTRTFEPRRVVLVTSYLLNIVLGASLPKRISALVAFHNCRPQRGVDVLPSSRAMDLARNDAIPLALRIFYVRFARVQEQKFKPKNLYSILMSYRGRAALFDQWKQLHSKAAAADDELIGF